MLRVPTGTVAHLRHRQNSDGPAISGEIRDLSAQTRRGGHGSLKKRKEDMQHDKPDRGLEESERQIGCESRRSGSSDLHRLMEV